MLDTPRTPTEDSPGTPDQTTGPPASPAAPAPEMTPPGTAPEPAESAPPSAPATAVGDGPERANPRHRRWLWVLASLLVLSLALYLLWPTITGANSKAAAAKAAKGPAPIQVVAVTATKGNIGVYFTGLGAVTPLATVTVKTIVGGHLMNVHFKEGDLVQKGDLLIEIDPRPYEAVVAQIEGQLMRDQALLANARIDLDRYAGLMKTNAIPEQQYATQQTLVTQDEGIVKNDQGLLDAAKLNVTYSRISSPITGVVGLRLVDPGNIVQPGDSNGMIVITQIQPISVIFTVGEDQLPPILQKIRAGQTLTADAWDHDLKNKLASGTLATLDNEIDQTTGTLKLRATFDNTNRALFPNQFVNARLLEQEKTGVTLLPSAAIQRNTNNIYVYLVKPDNTVTVRTILTGTTEGDQSEITSGLAPGDKVVMTGVDKLQEGSKVALNTNGAAGNSGAAGSGGAIGTRGATGSGVARGAK